MAYRSIYDEDGTDLGIGGQEYLVGTDGVVNSMYNRGDYQTGQYDLTPQADRPQSLTDEQQTLNMPAGKGVKGGKGASGIIGSIIGAAGGVASAGDAAYQKNYASRGLTAAAEGKGIYGSINKVKESGALGNIAGTIAQNTAVDYQAVDRSFRSGKYGRALGQIAMHGLTGAGTFGGTSLISGGEQREYAEQQALLNPNVAPIRGAATGGMMGYATGGESGYDVKKIDGPEGIDNVPIDGDMNDAGVTGRTIQGFAQKGETVIKLKGKNYVFSTETDFSKEADTLVRKYKYNKEEDSFEGDDLAEAAFASDISKLRDEQEAFNSSIVMDNYGMPEVDTQGEYIIRDPNILNKIAKRRKTSSKRLANKLGETTITQRVKEFEHSQEQGMATGGYPEISEGINYGGYATGGTKPDELQAAINESSVGLIKDKGFDANRALEDMRDLIFGAESKGNYNAIAGSKGNWVSTDPDYEGLQLSELTIGELLQIQRASGKNQKAAGAYQIIPDTLEGLVDAGILDEGDVFDKATQDKAFKALLDQRGYEEFLSGEKTKDQFSKSLGMEWAGIPMLSDTTRTNYTRDTTGKRVKKETSITRGDSYYQGIGGNKATASVEDVEEWFEKYGDGSDITYEGGTLPEVEIIEESDYEKPKARDIGANIAQDVTPTLMDPSDPLPNSDLASTGTGPFKGPFKKFREKRWMKRHEDEFRVNDEDMFQNEYMASVNDSVKGVATGGYFPGYATGDEQEEEGRGGFGQTARVLGMMTPAAYNIGYALTQEPKKLSGDYMTSGIPNPEPIDITPELRDIEKAGASARAGGRARSSMAGQIASQTAEQGMISKAYRAKTAIDQQADMEVEKMNASIRQQNARMEYQKDLQNIQAEEALQQYMNTGMSQIGQIAQTLGTESLQKGQIDAMQAYYETMGEQGQAMLDLEKERLVQEGAYMESLLNDGADPVIKGGDQDGDPTKVVLDKDGNPIVTPTSGATNLALNDEVLTAYGGQQQIWGPQVKSAGQSIAEQKDIAALEGWDIAFPKFSSPELSQDYTTAASAWDSEGPNVPLGRGFLRDTPVSAPGEEQFTINSLIGMEDGVPYIKSPELQQGFEEAAYIENEADLWEVFKEKVWLDPDIPDTFDALASYGTPEEAMHAMVNYLGSEGYTAESMDKEGNITYSKHKEGQSGFALDVQTPGSWETWKPPTKLQRGASYATLAMEILMPTGKTGVVKKGVGVTQKIVGGLSKNRVFLDTALGWERLAKGSMIVPKGYKAVMGPGGEIAFTKANQFVLKGWKKIAGAGQDVGEMATKFTGRRGKLGKEGVKATQAALKELGVSSATSLPHNFYVPSAGGAVLDAAGKTIGWTAKKVTKIPGGKALVKKLGDGRDGMVKLYKKAKYIYKNNGWWKLTKEATKEGIKRSTKGTVGTTRRFGESVRVGYTGKAAREVSTNFPNIDISKLGKPIQNALKSLKGSTKAQKISELKKNLKLTKAQRDKAIDAVMKGWSKIKPGGGGTAASSSSTATAGSNYVYTTP